MMSRSCVPFVQLCSTLTSGNQLVLADIFFGLSRLFNPLLAKLFGPVHKRRFGASIKKKRKMNKLKIWPHAALNSLNLWSCTFPIAHCLSCFNPACVRAFYSASFSISDCYRSPCKFAFALR